MLTNSHQIPPMDKHNDPTQYDGVISVLSLVCLDPGAQQRRLWASTHTRSSAFGSGGGGRGRTQQIGPHACSSGNVNKVFTK